MESPAGRLLRLLSLLQSRPHWKAGELAERLDVTERTVRRDVTHLRDLGYPVAAEPGPAGGYRLGSGGTLPPLLLSDDEAVAVAVGLRLAAGAGVAEHDEAAVAALTKLEQVLPVRLRGRVAALAAATTPLRSHGGPRVDPETLLSLAQGCRRPERVRLRYCDSSGRRSDRRVEPRELVNVGRRWYLVAFDLDRSDWRTFRVDRVDEASLTGHAFTHSDPPDGAQLVAEALAVVAYERHAEVMLKTDMAKAAEEIAPTVGRLEPAEDGTLLRIGANDLEWIAGFLAGLPFPFEVRDPPDLRDALCDLGRRLVAEHSG